MIFFIIAFFLLGWRTFPCDCLPGITKHSTITTPAGHREPAQSPQPTPPAILGQKRDTAGSITCGFVDGEYGPSPVTCSNTLQTCDLIQNLSFAGCCETTYNDRSSGYVEECEYYDFCTGYYGTKSLFTLSLPVPAFLVSLSDVASVSSAIQSEFSPIQYSLAW